MKKLLLCLCLLNWSDPGNAQNYFSTATSSNDYLNTGGMIQFNHRNLIIASEYCGGFINSDCGYILEAGNDGSISYLHDLGEIYLFDRAFTSNDNKLIIVGTDANSSITIFQFDTSMVETQQQTYNVSTSLWIFDVIEYAGYYVVAAYNYGSSSTNSNFPRLYWFDTADLSLDYEYIDELNGSTFQELTIDNNNNLKVFNYKNNKNYILTFNMNKELIGEWETPENGHIGYINFEMAQNDHAVFGLVDNKYLKCYNSEGQLNWEKNIASAFDISKIQYIRQLKEVSTGDFLLCGSLLKNDFEYGFIYMLSSNGTEKWKRLYSIDGSHSNRLKDFRELSDDEYLFYGSSRLGPFPDITNADDTHWVLKTNANGCIDDYCGNEITITGTGDVSNVNFSTYPNPVVTNLILEGLEDGQMVQFRVTDIRGSIKMQGPSSSHVIDMSLLDSGVYFLTIFSKETGSLTQKIIKGTQ